MGFLIDTNVLSEFRKKGRANPGVTKWISSVNDEDIYISVLTIGEIRNGVERLRKRDPYASHQINLWLLRMERELSDRILPITREIADRWGHLGVPDPLPVVDALLAATALEHNLILVTRNESDVKRTHVRLINPFTEPDNVS